MEIFNSLRKNQRDLLIALGLLVAIIGFLYVSKMSYEDELFAKRDYCEGVKSGAWPDYNKNFANICIKR